MFMRVAKWSSLAAAVAVTVRSSAAHRPRRNRRPRARRRRARSSISTSATSASRSTRCRKTSRSGTTRSSASASSAFRNSRRSKYLTDILKQNGFTVQHGVAGIPTAWTARWGSGKPVIALGSDIDCIPQASQKPGVAYHDPIIEGAPGHGEGHNSGMPLQIAAALAVKKVMEQQHLPGHADAVAGRRGRAASAPRRTTCAPALFKDVDVSIFAHVGDNLGVTWGDGTQNGLVSVEYSFKGESAHARQRAVARPLGARRRGADGHRLELPPRAPAHPAALALCHHQRRRPAERRAAERVGLVLLPRDRLRRTSRRCGTSATGWRRPRR